jgi:uncharacterized membrane protein YgdD (TMEM256/DUF423 family)
MHKGFLKTGIIIGALSVILGAFAAHSLKNTISDYALGIFETAVRYQFYHAFALVITGILFKEFPRTQIKLAGRFFIAGIILFSGSLFLLAIIKAAVQPGFNWVGAITPFGGLCFILGWICLFTGIRKKVEL